LVAHNRTSRFHNILYHLKRQYRTPVDLFNKVSDANDLTTGLRSVKYVKLEVKKGIVLPTRQKRDFVYDLAFISANRNFTEGGYFHISTRTILLDGKDVPSDFVIDMDTFVQYNEQRYEIKEVMRTIDKRGYILIVENAETYDLISIINRKVETTMSISHVVE